MAKNWEGGEKKGNQIVIKWQVCLGHISLWEEPLTQNAFLGSQTRSALTNSGSLNHRISQHPAPENQQLETLSTMLGTVKVSGSIFEQLYLKDHKVGEKG